MYTKNQSIRNLVKKNKILIAAHRGTCGGNVVQNTCMSYKNALLHGADMIEVDVSMTTDGVFYAFHNGEEPLELGIDRDIRTMTSEEVDQLYTLNSVRHVCRQKLEHLEEVLESFRGKCLINIDRSWFYWKEIIALLDGMDMKDQILLKSGVEEDLLKELEESGTGIMYMPIMKRLEEWDTIKKYNINVAAAELIFTDLESEFLSPGFMEQLKEAGIVPWVNAITLDDDTILSGLLDDNNAIKTGYEETWGKLMDFGFEIIQTDWPALLKGYILNKFKEK
ncbi:glycerophosphodiester phosphodiesterase family protein [Lacrimispora brassicae]